MTDWPIYPTLKVGDKVRITKPLYDFAAGESVVWAKIGTEVEVVSVDGNDEYYIVVLGTNQETVVYVDEILDPIKP